MSAAFAGPDGQIEPLRRITDFLATETDALRRFAPCDLAAGNRIKAQALLELTRHARTLTPGESHPTLRDALKLLQRRLTENQAAVLLHLEAARTVTAIIVDAVEKDGSDRTYARATGGGNRRQ